MVWLEGPSAGGPKTRRAFLVRFFRGIGPPPDVQYINAPEPMREQGSTPYMKHLYASPDQ